MIIIADNSNLNKILTEIESHDDVALISHYWYIRPQCEVYHNERLAPAWQRIQENELAHIQKEAQEAAAYIQAVAILKNIVPEHIRQRYVTGGVLCVGDPRGEFTVTFDEAIKAKANVTNYETLISGKFNVSAASATNIIAPATFESQKHEENENPLITMFKEAWNQ